MLISVICPTKNRPDRHPLLYSLFSQQSHTDRELIIFDDSDEPSPFFTLLKDEKVRYLHEPGNFPIGTKRNHLIAMSKGEIIAHFDDDDYYAPGYLEAMLKSLAAASFVKLSKWLIFREVDGSIWEWDTRELSSLHYLVSGKKAVELFMPTRQFWDAELEHFLDSTLWGFGFSYLYRKSLWQSCPFPDSSIAEDYIFVKSARVAGAKLLHTPDLAHLALHTLHPTSSSLVVPQHRLAHEEALSLLGQAALPWLSG